MSVADTALSHSRDEKGLKNVEKKGHGKGMAFTGGFGTSAFFYYGC